MCRGAWWVRRVLLGHSGSGCLVHSCEFFIGHAGVLEGAGVGDGDEFVGVHGCHVVQAGAEECDVGG